MKKVWILEKFANNEEQAKYYELLKETLEFVKANKTANDIDIASLEMTIANYEDFMKDNPNGHWYGFEGKVIYRQFCDVAKAAIRRNPEGKFRVVEGEIEDNAKYWGGYKMTKVNDGVIRYLMATK